MATKMETTMILGSTGFLVMEVVETGILMMEFMLSYSTQATTRYTKKTAEMVMMRL